MESDFRSLMAVGSKMGILPDPKDDAEPTVMTFCPPETFFRRNELPPSPTPGRRNAPGIGAPCDDGSASSSCLVSSSSVLVSGPTESLTGFRRVGARRPEAPPGLRGRARRVLVTTGAPDVPDESSFSKAPCALSSPASFSSFFSSSICPGLESASLSPCFSSTICSGSSTVTFESSNFDTAASWWASSAALAS